MTYQTWTVREGVLNDDTLTVADPGYRFRGGCVAYLDYYTYANPWANYRHRRGFRTLEAAKAFIAKRYRDDEDIEDVEWSVLEDVLGPFTGDLNHKAALIGADHENKEN